MVVVQVVLGQVRERGHREVGAPGALQVERVRAYLHGHHRAACVPHAGEELLQVGRLGSGVLGVLHTPGDLVAHRADDAAAVAGHARDMLHQIGRGGLAVGTRNAHEREVGRGVVVEAHSGMGHGLAGIGHHHLGNVGGIGQIHLALNHQRRGAAIDGVLGKGVAVHHIAYDAEEHVARLDGIGAERQARHLLVAVADDGAFHSLEELCASMGHGSSIPLRLRVVSLRPP